MDYWEQYYQKNSPDNTPWTGTAENLLTKLWEKYNLPLDGNLLDVGCGRGDKSIYLAGEMGFNVWGFDISQTAINDAIASSIKMNNKPTFWVADASKIGDSTEIKGIKFNVVIDLVATQFLNREEKTKYLTELKPHLYPYNTFYILNTFVKDNDKDEMKGYLPWVKDIAQSPQDIEDTYGKYFDIEDELIKLTPKGKVGTYILIAK